MSGAFERATRDVVESDLSPMVLGLEELPRELRDFQLAREGVMDNETMAEHGFPGSTTEETRATGRITGYLREFLNPVQPGALQTGSNIVAATVVHLFLDSQAVSRWMTEKFLGEFQRTVGKDLGRGQQLISVDRIHLDGFSDEAVGLRNLQSSDAGVVSSTIADFRVGRLLGVAYLVSLGDVERAELAREIGIELERKIVKVLLDAT